MTSKLNTFFVVATVLGGLAAATAAWAGPKDMFPPNTPRRSTGDSGGMADMMGKMSPDQMPRMMNDCNAMMKSARIAPHQTR